MKARVKATGEIITLGPPRCSRIDPDYWTRLEHQAAIAAMQAQMAPDCLDSPEGIACTAYAYARALVEKMKVERK
jgi:hypothetical protein